MIHGDKAMRIRVRLRDNWILLSLLSFTPLLASMIVIREGTIDWGFYAVVCMPLCLFLLWLRSQFVSIDGDMFVYWNTLRKRETRISRIRKIRFQWGKPGYKSNGLYLLCIYDDDKYSKNPIPINVKPFGVNALAKIIVTLRERNPEIEVDKTVERMANRKKVQFYPLLLNMFKRKKRRR